MTRGTIIQLVCRKCGNVLQVKRPMVSVDFLNDERRRSERLVEALERIRDEVLDTEGDKAVRIADEALKQYEPKGLPRATQSTEKV